MTVVLHGLRAVIHEALIDIVVVYERLAGMVSKQVFRKRGYDFFGWHPTLRIF